MRSLILLHFQYLFSWKVFYITSLILLLATICFLYFSNFYLDYDLLLFNKQYYSEEYYFESISLIKIIVVLFNMFIVINSFILNKYDLLLISRRSKKEVIISKTLSLLIINNGFSIILYLLFLVTGMFLTPYMNISKLDLSLLGDILIFGSIYQMIYILVYVANKTIYALILVIVGYFISDIVTDSFIVKENVTSFSKILNIVFVNVNYYTNEGYSMLFGKTVGITVFIILFFCVVLIYYNSDIAN